MTTEQIKSSIAPCGLSCEKCFAHVNRDIHSYSLKLKETLGDFDNYAKRYEILLSDPVLKKYHEKTIKQPRGRSIWIKCFMKNETELATLR